MSEEQIVAQLKKLTDFAKTMIAEHNSLETKFNALELRVEENSTCNALLAQRLDELEAKPESNPTTPEAAQRVKELGLDN
jgi:hypothetical protein